MCAWRPLASLAVLQQRAAFLASIRQFFAQRGVLEIETPLLGPSTATDLHVHSLSLAAAHQRPAFLQTSPELFMKRLVAAYKIPVYQLSKAFRDDPQGRLHNPEFTILEWYRPNFDLAALMAEVDILFQQLLGCPPAQRISFQDLFLQQLNLDPFAATVEDLQRALQENLAGPIVGLDLQDRSELLDVLMSQVIEPRLINYAQAVFVYHFPVHQASQAEQLQLDGHAVGLRFEAYINGVEIANGYQELSNAQQQRQSFANDNQRRAAQAYPVIPLDENFLAALEYGLGACSGVAIGVDRLFMQKIKANSLDEVIAFRQ